MIGPRRAWTLMLEVLEQTPSMTTLEMWPEFHTRGYQGDRYELEQLRRRAVKAIAAERERGVDARERWAA